MSCSLGCPRGWSCDNGYCVPPGYSASCEAVGASGGASGAPAGGFGGATHPFGGAISSAGGISASSGGRALETGGESSNTGSSLGGSPGTTAAGAGDGGAPPSLDVQLTSPGSPCSGDVSLEFTTSAGTPPYVWSAEKTCGLALVPGEQGSARLEGTATSDDCVIAVSVKDSEGLRGQLTTTVKFREVPAIDTAKLTPACLFEEFAAELSAHGGDPATRRFETTTPSWSIIGNKLQTTVTAQTQRTVSVSVRDEYCSSPPVALDLPLEAAGSDRCFSIDPVPKPLPDTSAASLPAPCAGMPYDLRLESKPPPVSWKLIAVPPGLRAVDSGDPGALLLTGAATWAAGEASPLEFEMVGSDGRRFAYRYDLIPRDKCWFAYVGRSDARWQLHLLDADLQAQRDFGADNAEVMSFAFSPDGKFLVYESTQAARVTLTLVDVRTLREQALSFTGNVEHFQWSPDSALLAVVSRDTGTLLGGIDVSRVSTSLQGETGIQGVTYLEPLATEIESAPVWFGERSLVMASPSTLVPSGLFTRSVQIRSGSISKLLDLVDAPYESPLTLLGFSSGYVANDGFFLDFIDVTATKKVYPHDQPPSVFAPSGTYVANTVLGQLRWFRPSAVDTDAPVAQSESGECNAILAWTDAGDRTACVTGSDPGALRFLARGPGAATLSRTTVSSVDDYTELSSNERRRVFDRDGRHFAFTTDTKTYVLEVADLRNVHSYPAIGTATAAERATQADTIDLGFSPTGNFLAEHRARRLTLVDLTATTGGYWIVDPSMNMASNCSEQYLKAPTGWCGAPSTPRDFKWSPRTDRFAFLNSNGALSTAFVHAGMKALDHPQINKGCSGDCVRNFDFQP